MNLELRELVRAGAEQIQIDEPYYSGFPEDLPWARARHQRARRRSRRAAESPRLLRQPVRQAVVGGQLSVSVPGGPRGARSTSSRSSSRDGQRGPPPLQGVRRAVHARPRRGRRQDSRRRDRRGRGRADPRSPRDPSGRPPRPSIPTAACMHLPARSRSPSSAPWWRERSSSGASFRDDQPAAGRAGDGALPLRRRARRLGADARGAACSKPRRGSLEFQRWSPAASPATPAARWATIRCGSPRPRARGASRPTSI